MNDDFKQQVYESLDEVFGIMFYIHIKPLEDDAPLALWDQGKVYI